MAVGLGSTFEEVIKKINSCGDVTADGNNTFTGTNTFNSTLTCPGGVMSPIIYPGGENALTVPKKDGTLATIEDLTAQFGALNIQNGSGVKSIQQGADPKYNGVIKAASKNPYAKVLYPELTDAEPLGAIGDYAASFGGNSSVQAKRGIGGGTSSVTKGAYSQSLGDNTVTTPKASDSTAIGYQTTTDAPGAFTHGSFTVVMSQKYIEGMFDPSTKPGQGGSGQPTEPDTTPTDTLEMDSRRGEAASAGGFNSYSSGFAAEVDGVSNVADGHISKSSGRSNRSWSYLSKTDGKNSVVKPDPTNTDATGEGSWANGDNIQIIGAKYAYSGGNNNIVFAGADNSFSYGEGLQVKHKNQVVIGQYNDSSDSTNNDLVVVGAGTGNSNRKNAIRVTEDGKLYYGDFEVSNLKTTNDAIVSLDNKLTPKITGNTTEITKLWSTLRDTNTNLNRLNETKQATLVSGTNIKTINGNSLLGSGDLVIESGGGDVTAAGDNTFTGSNVFKKAVTLYTDAVNGNSMSATLDSYKLKLLNDLGGVYADLNITDDTAPYLELKTDVHGKVKYTPESIIFTDTYGSSKTTTLKFPGQGATADSIQTLATNEDLDKKQPLLVSGTNIKTINGQSILGEGDLEISGGGGSGGSGGIYVHVISFDFTESLNGSTCKGVITITNSSNDNFIVDTNISSNSLTNLTNFLSNINNSFYPLATTNTAGSNLPYIGISYNSDSSEYVVYLSDTSSQTAPVSITIDDTTFVETVIQTSTGGSGGGDSGSGVYTHLVSFGFYRTDDSDIAGWGSIMIPSASAAAIVGTSADNLKTFLAKFNGKFYPMAIKTDGYTTTPYTGIFVNPTNNSLNVVASASSGGNAEFAIDVYDVTETVV